MEGYGLSIKDYNSQNLTMSVSADKNFQMNIIDEGDIIVIMFTTSKQSI